MRSRDEARARIALRKMVFRIAESKAWSARRAAGGTVICTYTMPVPPDRRVRYQHIFVLQDLALARFDVGRHVTEELDRCARKTVKAWLLELAVPVVSP